MSDLIAATNRTTPLFTTVAVAMALATNLIPQPHADLSGAQSPIRYERTVTDPFIISGTRIAQLEKIAPITTTEFTSEIAVRWSEYVTRRLTELRVGAFDFTGLRIPAGPVINAAWAIAIGSFHHDTPTPSVLPSEDGDILFVWHKAGWDIEIEVGTEGTAVWAHDRRSGREFSGSFEEHRADFVEVLRTLAS